MNAGSARRHPWLLLWLAAVWVGLWGDVSVANVLGGLAVAALLLALVPPPDAPRQGRVQPVALLGFIGFFAAELVRASLVVVAQVLRPRGELRPAVLAVHLDGASDRLLTLVANSISLTPGTLTLDVDRDRCRIYVHVLDVSGPDGVERARRSIERLQHAAVLAVGSAEARAAMQHSRPGEVTGR